MPSRTQKQAKARNKPATPSVEIQGSDTVFRLLVESVKEYAIIMLDPDGMVATWNAGAERVKGYRAEEIIGKHFSVFYPEESIQQGLPQRELDAAKKDGKFEDESMRVRKDGSQFMANVIISSVLDSAGNLCGYAKITRDITDRKLAEQRIQQQSNEIMDLSTPVMQVWEGIVVAPLIGTLDSQRTQQFMERLLESIVATNSPVALVDIMGVPTIDTETAQHLIETVSAVRLLGAQVVLTGVRPAIAQTLVHLGVDLSDITTRSSLSAGLKVALEILELTVVSKNHLCRGAQ